MTFKIWIKRHHRQEITAGLVLFGTAVTSLIVYLVFFSSEHEASTPQKSQNNHESESSLLSSGDGGDDPPASPQTKGRTGKAVGNKNVILNSTDQNETRNCNDNKTTKPKATLMTSTFPHIKETENPVKKDLGNSEKIEESPDFRSTLKAFQKAGFTILPPTHGQVPNGNSPKPSSGDSYKVHLTEILSQNPNIAPSNQDTPFEKAHKKVIDLLINTLTRGSCDSGEKVLLENAFSAAKREAQSAPNDNEKSPFYKNSASIEEYIKNSFEFDRTFKWVSITFLLDGKCPAFKSRLELLYQCFHIFRILGCETYSFPGPKITFTSFETEADKLTELLLEDLKFLVYFTDLLCIEFSKPAPDHEKVQKMVDNWKSYNSLNLPRKTMYRTVHLDAIPYVTDIGSARNTYYNRTLSSLIHQYFASKLQDIAKARQKYDEIYKDRSAPSYFKIASSFDDLISRFTPAPVMSPQQVVLSTVPNRSGDTFSLRFAGALFQVLANFLPLFQKSPGFSASDISTLSSNFRNVVFKLATQPVQSINFSIDTPQNPMCVFEEFIKGFPNSGFDLIKVSGFVESYFEYSPRLANIEYNLGHSIDNIEMIGQLFIFSYGVDDGESSTRPDDIPVQIKLKVLGVKEKKSFELYSVIFGSSLYTTAYVKRSNGNWYEIKYNSDPKTVTVDSIPLGKRRQSSSCQPHMVFYLRTEA